MHQRCDPLLCSSPSPSWSPLSPVRECWGIETGSGCRLNHLHNVRKLTLFFDCHATHTHTHTRARAHTRIHAYARTHIQVCQGDCPNLRGRGGQVHWRASPEIHFLDAQGGKVEVGGSRMLVRECVYGGESSSHAAFLVDSQPPAPDNRRMRETPH